jgi:hypothetical protein
MSRGTPGHGRTIHLLVELVVLAPPERQVPVALMQARIPQSPAGALRYRDVRCLSADRARVRPPDDHIAGRRMWRRCGDPVQKAAIRRWAPGP